MHSLESRKAQAALARIEGKRATKDSDWSTLLSEATSKADTVRYEFLARISHEIRTPLAAVVGYSTMLKQSESLQGDDRKRLDRIADNSHYVLSLVSDLLDLSKIEAGKMSLMLQDCDVKALVHSLRSVAEPQAEAKGLRLSFNNVTPLPESVVADGLRIKQVLTNLVGNAIQYTAAGSVAVDIAWVASGSNRGRLEFRVRDTGSGIAPEHQTQIFEPFEQLDPLCDDRGSGLGLNISRRLTHMMGGTIKLDSALGHGSTFTFALELEALGKQGLCRLNDEPDPLPPKAPGLESFSLRDVRILLADDTADCREIISYYLSRVDGICELVSNGRDALDAAQAADPPFELIVMDMDMPLVDGFEAAAILRSKGYNVPIIALTAHAMPEDKQRCLDAGCSGYITKPAAADAFCREIARLLPQARSFSGSEPEPVALAIDGVDPKYRELIERYRKGLSDLATKVEDVYANSDGKTLKRYAHQLKGSGGAYGFPKISHKAARVEDLVGDAIVEPDPVFDRIELQSAVETLVQTLRETSL
ncbi:MAG: ATP-binding protein [Planctomycetota bacterium]